MQRFAAFIFCASALLSVAGGILWLSDWKQRQFDASYLKSSTEGLEAGRVGKPPIDAQDAPGATL